MAQTYASYTGNGSTTDFVVSFPYLSPSDVFVFVADVAVPATLVTAGLIRCTTAPGVGLPVRVQRVTPTTAVPVNFTDGSTLLEADLDTLVLWALYVVQESGDRNSSSSVRTLRVPPQEVTADLPAAVDRANKLMAFDGLGAVTVVAPVAGTAVALAIALLDPTQASSGAGAVVVGSAINYASGTVGFESRSSRALRSGRVAPHVNFVWFTNDFTVTGCAGPGQASVQQDIYDVWMSKYSGLMTGSGATPTYVSPAGNDTTGTGTYAAPYLTLDKAVRTINSGLVYALPGAYESTGFRDTDTQGDRPKMIVAPFGGVAIRTPGDPTPISGVTWAVNGTYPNVYETTLTTTNHAIRILLSTNVDKLGLPLPMPKQSSVATVDSSGFGWWYDSATRKVYVRNGSENVNAVTKAFLSAVYATGGDNSVVISGARLYLENIILLKYPSVLKTAGPLVIPEVWLKNCTIRYAEGNSRLVSGGGAYSQGGVFYRSAADHANYNTALGTTAYGVEINDSTYFAGDVDSFPVVAGAQPTNPIAPPAIKNGSSNHNGYVVRINGTHEGCFGPPIADTVDSFSWNLGVTTGYSLGLTTQKYGFIVQGSTARSWYDGCRAGAGNSGFNSDLGAVGAVFNSFGAQTLTAAGTMPSYFPA